MRGRKQGPVASSPTPTISDSVIRTLPAGYGFNLRTKRPILPGGEEIPPVGTR